jgi:hypothetical protein
MAGSPVDSTPASPEIDDPKTYALWLLKRFRTDAYQDPFYVEHGYYSCQDCPWGAKTSEPDSEIWNDRSEANYICPVLKKEVWGKKPECQKHQSDIMRKILEGVADWSEFLVVEAAEIAERNRRTNEEAAARASGLAKLSDAEIKALYIHIRHNEKKGASP